VPVGRPRRQPEPTGDGAQKPEPGGDGAQEPGGEGPQRQEPAEDGWQRQLGGLGSFIRMQRRLADMSLREMASLTSVSNAYLSQIERGLHQPSLRVLRSIAQALSIAPEDLLRRANFMTPKDEGADTPGRDATPPDTEAAIQADPRLTPAQRDALLNVYRSFRDQA
jgi:transcriptional regulator with XRE-family HTH domain